MRAIQQGGREGLREHRNTGTTGHEQPPPGFRCCSWRARLPRHVARCPKNSGRWPARRRGFSRRQGGTTLSGATLAGVSADKSPRCTARRGMTRTNRLEAPTGSPRADTEPLGKENTTPSTCTVEQIRGPNDKRAGLKRPCWVAPREIPSLRSIAAHPIHIFERAERIAPLAADETRPARRHGVEAGSGPRGADKAASSMKQRS